MGVKSENIGVVSAVYICHATNPTFKKLHKLHETPLIDGLKLHHLRLSLSDLSCDSELSILSQKSSDGR